MTNFDSDNITFYLESQDVINHLNSVLPPFESLTTLKTLSLNSKELHGKCPNPSCNASIDGFRYTPSEKYAFCRQCTPRGNDLVGWHCLINGVKHPSELLTLYPIGKTITRHLNSLR